MSVYFATCREANAVKIGHSLDPWGRLPELQYACPLPITIEAVLPGAREEELTFHRRFEDENIHGEWFRISEMIELIIQANPAPPKPQKKNRTELNRERIARKAAKRPKPRDVGAPPSCYRSGASLPLGTSARHDRKRYEMALAEMRAAQAGA